MVLRAIDLTGEPASVTPETQVSGFDGSRSTPTSIFAATPSWIRLSPTTMNLYDALRETEGQLLQDMISERVGASYLEWIIMRIGDILNATFSAQVYKKLGHKTTFKYIEDDLIFTTTCYIRRKNPSFRGSTELEQTIRPPLKFPEDGSVPDFESLEQALLHTWVSGTIDEDGSLELSIPQWVKFASFTQGELREWYQQPLESIITEFGFTSSGGSMEDLNDQMLAVQFPQGEAKEANELPRGSRIYNIGTVECTVAKKDRIISQQQNSIDNSGDLATRRRTNKMTDEFRMDSNYDHGPESEANEVATGDAQVTARINTSGGTSIFAHTIQKVEFDLNNTSVIIGALEPLYMCETDKTATTNIEKKKSGTEQQGCRLPVNVCDVTENPLVMRPLYEIITPEGAKLRTELSNNVGVFMAEWFLARQMRILSRKGFFSRIKQLYHHASIFRRVNYEDMNPSESADWIINLTCSLAPFGGATVTKYRQNLNVPVIEEMKNIFQTKEDAIRNLWVKIIVDSDNNSTIEVPRWINMMFPTFGDQARERITASFKTLGFEFASPTEIGVR